MRIPTANDAMAMARTPPAARSLMTLIFLSFSGCIKSQIPSMAVLNNSAENTKPMHKAIDAHSKILTLKKIVRAKTKN